MTKNNDQQRNVTIEKPSSSTGAQVLKIMWKCSLFSLLFLVPLLLSIGICFVRHVLSRLPLLSQIYHYIIPLPLIVRCLWLLIELLGATTLYILFLALTTMSTTSTITQDQNSSRPERLVVRIRKQVLHNVEEYFVPPVLKQPVRRLGQYMIPPTVQKWFTGEEEVNPTLSNAATVDNDKVVQRTDGQGHPSSTKPLLLTALSLAYQLMENVMAIVRVIYTGPMTLVSIIVKTIVWECGLGVIFHHVVYQVLPVVTFVLVLRFVLLPYPVFELYWHTILVGLVFRSVGLLVLLSVTVSWPIMMLLIQFSPFVRRLWFLMLEHVFHNEKDGFVVSRSAPSSPLSSSSATAAHSGSVRYLISLNERSLEQPIRHSPEKDE